MNPASARRENDTSLQSGFTDGLPRISPGPAGVDAGAVRAFVQDVAAAGLDLHSFMLSRAGRVVAEAWWWPCRAERPHLMHSLTKSFTACGIGLAVAEGRLACGDRVISFFPEFRPPAVDPWLAAMTVEDLLTMRVGHAEETSGASWRGIATSWVAEFFKIPLAHPPGTAFVYTSAASYMLSAILTKLTGETLHDYLRPRLFEPLGIVGEQWDIGPDGINPGGNGLTCKTADILKLGILHSQGGCWNGRQILPADWVAAATRPHANDYGYHWVTSPRGDYRAVGLFAQLAMVFPAQDAVLAVTAGIDGSARLLPIIYRHFPAAFKAAPLDNPAADAALVEKLAEAARPKLPAGTSSPLPATISGWTYRVAPNPQDVTALQFDFNDDRCTFRLTDAEGDHAIVMGFTAAVESRVSLPGHDLHHGYRLKDALVAASVRWRDSRTLEMTWIFAETAFRDTITCRFDAGRVTLDRAVNVNSGALSQPTLTGNLGTN